MSIRPSGPPPLAGGGGGGSVTARQSVLYGNAVTVASETLTPLTIDAVTGDTGLVDATDPENPFVTAAGLYVVVFVINVMSQHAGKKAELTGHLDYNNADFYGQETMPLDGAGASRPSSKTFTVSFAMTAGAVLRSTVQHDVGSPADFSVIQASVSCIPTS